MIVLRMYDELQKFASDLAALKLRLQFPMKTTISSLFVVRLS
jgi:hypothetical protein